MSEDKFENNFTVIGRDEAQLDLEILGKELKLKSITEDIPVSSRFICYFRRVSNFLYINSDPHHEELFNMNRLLMELYLKEDEVRVLRATLRNWDEREDVPGEEVVRVKTELLQVYESLEKVIRGLDEGLE